jgi:Ca2+-binding RTX toxin-like protein
MMSPRRALLLGLCCAAAIAALAPAAQAAGPRVTFSKHVLKIEGGDPNDKIIVRCSDDGNATMNGRNPRGGAIACSRVSEIDVISGGGNDYIDVRGVDARFADADFEGFGNGTGVAVLAGSGDDRLIGTNHAFILFLGHEGDDHASGGRRRDILTGGLGNDDLNGLAGRDSVLGKAGNDRLRGGDGKDLLSGNGGADRLFGEAGADLLGGGPGPDKLRGGPGDDILHGGTGRDSLDGGPGDDELVQNPPKRKR